MNLSEFYYEYFAKTIVLDNGYNIVNTFTYILIAFIIYFFLVKYIIKKLDYQLDLSFFLSITFFTLFGCILRVSEEPYSNIDVFTRSASPLEIGYYFITPGIYILVLLIVLMSMLISYFASKWSDLEKNKILLTASILLTIPALILVFIKMTRLIDFIIILVLIPTISYVIFKFLSSWNLKLDKFEFLALTAQITDGFATYYALTFTKDFVEQHYFSNILINTFGTISFLIAKILICLALIWILRRTQLSEFSKKYILLFIMIFGFATGARDVLSIALHK